MMKEIKKGKVRSVKDIKVVVRFKGQSEAVLYTNAFGEKFYSDSALYGDIFPATGALCGADGINKEAEFLRQAFQKRTATAKIMRMSHYCSSVKGMITEALSEQSAPDLFTGALNIPYAEQARAEFEPLPLEDIYYMSLKKNTAESDQFELSAGEAKVHAEYCDREDDVTDTEGNENPDGYVDPDGYVEVSTTGKLTEYERHYMISYCEYYQPLGGNAFLCGFDGKRNVSVLIFKNNPDVIMISYNEFNDEFLTFVKNKTTVDFYSDDFNEPSFGFDDELDEESGAETAPPEGMAALAGIDYLTINTGDVTSAINGDNGGLKLNYTVGLFSGILGFAEYSLKYQVL